MPAVEKWDLDALIFLPMLLLNFACSDFHQVLQIFSFLSFPFPWLYKKYAKKTSLKRTCFCKQSRSYVITCRCYNCKRLWRTKKEQTPIQFTPLLRYGRKRSEALNIKKGHNFKHLKCYLITEQHFLNFWNFKTMYEIHNNDSLYYSQWIRSFPVRY